MSKKIVSIIGATGYTGLELIRLLTAHPNTELKYVTSENHTGQKLCDVWPHLQGICELTLSNSSLEKIAKESDCVFLALPHLQSQKIVKKLLGTTKLIDLSADFRLKDPLQFKQAYGVEHTLIEAQGEFVYGVPEFTKSEIAEAQNIANPGCFAIAVELALYPIKEMIDSVYVQGITGSSGSGKSPGNGTHHPIRNHNVKSYRIGSHQHEVEIIQELNLSSNQFVLVPTSGPFVRGIHITAFLDLKTTSKKGKIFELFKKSYKNSPFIRIKPEVQIADVVGSNYCDISINFCGGKIVVQAVIDNLVKGASGNAIQNFNLMFGFEEVTGLKSLTPLFP